MNLQSEPATTYRTPTEALIANDGRRRPRRIVVGVSLAVLVIVASLVALVFWAAPTGPGSAAPTPLPTVPITTGNLVSATNTRATLHYSDENALLAGPTGTVTSLPDAGTVITPGGNLYRVDNRPVVLLRGSMPAWRSFEIGMTDGNDVLQLEQNLTAFGVPFQGDIDNTFTKATADAISAWQKKLGIEPTGRLDRTAVLFSDHDLRVARETVLPGAAVTAGTELYKVSSTVKLIDLDLRLADQQLATVSNQVSILLPDGTTTTGTISAVGEPVERTSTDDSAADAAQGATGTFVVPVTVTLGDQTAVTHFSRASVTVQFPSTLAEGVLTVPVDALIATSTNSFAVQTPGDTSDATAGMIPVTVGAFASGRVQISGEGIHEGLNVVVPRS